MAVKQIVECDMCGKAGAETIHVATPEETWQIDLCSMCLAPLAALKPRPNLRFRKLVLPPQPN